MLDSNRVAQTYDRIGRLQDLQSFYEDRATDDLIAHARFDDARAVFELGCGTGRFAARLLDDHLGDDARYVGADISPRMVGLATDRLRRFGTRAQIRLSRRPVEISEPDGSVDRFVANYVLDLLGPAHTEAILSEAHRVLAPNGKLCLVSLTHGREGVSRVVSAGWRRVWSRWPALVGGCRPIELTSFLAEESWSIEYRAVPCAWGLCSEVVVASKS